MQTWFDVDKFVHLNDLGEIIAVGRTIYGETHALLLTPYEIGLDSNTEEFSEPEDNEINFADTTTFVAFFSPNLKNNYPTKRVF